jgi:hypothetical protein
MSLTGFDQASLGSGQAPTGSAVPLIPHSSDSTLAAAVSPGPAACSDVPDDELSTVAQKRSPSLDLETDQNAASPFVRGHPVDEAFQLPGVLALGPAGPFKPTLSTHPLQRCVLLVAAQSLCGMC